MNVEGPRGGIREEGHSENGKERGRERDGRQVRKGEEIRKM